MKDIKTNRFDTKKLVLAALLTALVVILQYVGSNIRFGVFSISLVLIPIVIGAATCGAIVGAWLGFMFGFTVLISGDAAPFMALSIPATVVTVLAKGIGCGVAAAYAYKLVYYIMNKHSHKKTEFLVSNSIICDNCKDKMYTYISRNSKYVAVLAAAIVCPVVNTGIFFLGCELFFIDLISEWAGSTNVYAYIIFVMIGINFLIEVGTNIVLNPVIVRLLNARKN